MRYMGPRIGSALAPLSDTSTSMSGRRGFCFLPFCTVPRLLRSTNSRTFVENISPSSISRQLHLDIFRTFPQGRIHHNTAIHLIAIPLTHRLHSQNSSKDRNPDVDEETAPPQGCFSSREETRRRPSTDPPPLPVQPVNIPGGPPSTFSITNNPSLDAALTTVIGLGLGT